MTLFGGLLLISCSKPNAKQILKASYKKCQSITKGYYENTRYMKYISGQDTSVAHFNCYFEKLPHDTIYALAFHYQDYQNEQYSRDIMYTGNDFVSYSAKDSVGTIMPTKLWAKDIKARRHNYNFFDPITNNKSKPLPHDSTFSNARHVFKMLGKETINNTSCYHIQMNIIPKNDSTSRMQTLRAEFHYWINKQNYLPMQYSTTYDFVMDNDTMSQFEQNTLQTYELNQLEDTTQLTLASVPAHVRLKDYKPYKSPELLSKGTAAPNWSLMSLEDKQVNLSDLKGNIVLLDFFYKSCYPCMQALPDLQALHEKYHNKGLKVIGINPYDTKKEDEIDTFLQKRGITYTIVLGAKQVAKDYHISGYPTIYLIDKKGKVLYTHIGYGKNMKKTLEEVIKAYL